MSSQQHPKLHITRNPECLHRDEMQANTTLLLVAAQAIDSHDESAVLQAPSIACTGESLPSFQTTSENLVFVYSSSDDDTSLSDEEAGCEGRGKRAHVWMKIKSNACIRVGQAFQATIPECIESTSLLKGGNDGEAVVAGSTRKRECEREHGEGDQMGKENTSLKRAKGKM